MAKCLGEHCAVGQYVQGDNVHGGNLALKTKTEINWYIRVFWLRRHSQETAQLSSLVVVSSGMCISTVQECMQLE